MQATLVIVEPKLTPSEYTVDLPATIGRGREANVKFAHGLLSRQHCELVEDDGGILVRDLGSRNGTFVSGRRIESAPLAPGELLTVGGITFRAQYGDPEDVALAPEDAEAAKAKSLAETIPMDDTLTVSAKSLAERHLEEQELEEWPEEEMELEMEEVESAPLNVEEKQSGQFHAEELDAEELDWLDEAEPGSTAESPTSKQPKPADNDDDFDKFLDGLK